MSFDVDETCLEQARICFVKFFRQTLPDLHWSYGWTMPTRLEPDCKASPYAQTVAWKKATCDRWNKARDADRILIVEEIVQEWGGIRGNGKQTLQGYVERCTRPDPETPLIGVASYSKVLSVVQPDRYAIYDARVSVALNAVQYLHGAEKGIAFNYVPGRNVITGHAALRKGFPFDPRFTVANLQKKGWQTVERDMTYTLYLRLLHSVIFEFEAEGYRLHDLEMVLFSEAERLALKVMYGH